MYCIDYCSYNGKKYALTITKLMIIYQFKNFCQSIISPIKHLKNHKNSNLLAKTLTFTKIIRIRYSGEKFRIF